MSRRAKGARLWLEPEERDQQGKLVRRATWVIRDGSHKIRTGCARDDREGAERALAEYIAKKYKAPRERGRHPSEILILDVLNVYLAYKAPKHSDPSITTGRIMTLAAWWGDKTLAQVNGTTCREYVAHRTAQPRRAARPEVTGKPARMVTAAGARRELEDLRSAINHHRTEGLCSEVVGVALPDKSEPREDWLTRSEAARLIWAAWRARQKMGEGITDRPVGRHLARFILVGLYTGTRHAAICSAAFNPAIGRGHIDLDSGVFYRRPQGRPKSVKPRFGYRIGCWRICGAGSGAVLPNMPWSNGTASRLYRSANRSLLLLRLLSTDTLLPTSCATPPRPGRCSAVRMYGRRQAGWA